MAHDVSCDVENPYQITNRVSELDLFYLIFAYISVTSFFLQLKIKYLQYYILQRFQE